MAVPFNIPEDQNEVEVIINQLQTLLTKLQAAIRRSRDSRSANAQQEQPSTSRVRQNGSNRSTRARDEATSNSSSISPNIPDLLNNLTWLATVSQETAVNSPQLTTISIVRSPRRRTSSESSNCEETKITTTAIVNQETNQIWNQMGSESISHLPKLFSVNGLLSKLVPGPVSGPLWTAMICFVGWHLFKAR